MFLLCCVDVGLDAPDKNLITLFLSYLYQRMVKGSTVKIVKKEITGPTETTKASLIYDLF